VVKESQYTREYGADGKLQLVPLDIAGLAASGLLVAVQPETELELEDYVSFATEVDDGEAQALAIAKNRAYSLLTDDYRAAVLARDPSVRVNVISSTDVLKRWAGFREENDARIPQIVRRISELARFTPRADSSDHAWWIDKLGRAP
jgi:hypothetical protein